MAPSTVAAFRAWPIPTSVLVNRRILSGNPILTESLEIEKRPTRDRNRIARKVRRRSNGLWKCFIFSRNVENLSALWRPVRCEYNVFFFYQSRYSDSSITITRACRFCFSSEIFSCFQRAVSRRQRAVRRDRTRSEENPAWRNVYDPGGADDEGIKTFPGMTRVVVSYERSFITAAALDRHDRVCLDEENGEKNPETFALSYARKNWNL